MIDIKKITITYLTILFILLNYTSIPYIFYIVAAVIYFIILAYGSFFIRSNLYLKSIYRIKNNERIVIMTFNINNSNPFLPSLLDLLKEKDVPALFFCTGDFIRENKADIERINREGNIIGNHSLSYSKNFGFYPTSALTDKLKQTEQLISGITNKEVRYFRPPFGITNPSVKKAICKMGYIVIAWSMKFSVNKLKNRKRTLKYLKKIKPGAIISISLDEIEDIGNIQFLVDEINKQHYRFVNLDKII